jgi:hypothetical protein
MTLLQFAVGMGFCNSVKPSLLKEKPIKPEFPIQNQAMVNKQNRSGKREQVA